MARALLMVLVALSLMAATHAQDMITVGGGSLTISGDWVDILANSEASASLEMALKEDLIAVLEVELETDNIDITSMTAGSLIVTFSIVVPAEYAPSAEDIAEFVASTTAIFADLVSTGNTEWLAETTALYQDQTGDSEATLMLEAGGISGTAGFAVASTLMIAIASLLSLLA